MRIPIVLSKACDNVLLNDTVFNKLAVLSQAGPKTLVLRQARWAVALPADAQTGRYHIGDRRRQFEWRGECDRPLQDGLRTLLFSPSALDSLVLPFVLLVHTCNCAAHRMLVTVSITRDHRRATSTRGT